jgi:hypothetical protein
MRRYENRETWLNAAAEIIMGLGREEVPEMRTDRKYRVSCGLPSRGAFASKKRIGECWHETCTTDEINEIYISPVLSDPLQVFATLMHELCHVVAGLEAKHGKGFARVARAIGLTGKMSATVLDEETTAWALRKIEALGDYPHGSLTGRDDPTKKKQTTRMHKALCPECDYTFRIAKAHAEKGLPLCPVCKTQIEIME